MRTLRALRRLKITCVRNSESDALYIARLRLFQRNNSLKII